MLLGRQRVSNGSLNISDLKYSRMMPVEVCHGLGCLSWSPHPHFPFRTIVLINVTKEERICSREPREVLSVQHIGSWHTSLHSLNYGFRASVLL